jgi:hypothetical protein
VPHAAIDAVADLIRTRTTFIEINLETRYRVKGPCLLAMLEEAITAGSNSRTGGVPGSRPPIAVDAWDLWVSVQTSTRGWARHLGLDRSRYETDPATRARHGFVTPPVGRLLRGVAATAVSTGQGAVSARVTTSARTWARSIETMLAGEPEQRHIRATCPACDAATVRDLRDEDGRTVPYLIPALSLTTWESLRWVCCSGCGWSQSLSSLAESGVSLDAMAGQAA